MKKLSTVNVMMRPSESREEVIHTCNEMVPDGVGIKCHDCGKKTLDPIYYKKVWCNDCFEETKAR